VQRKRAKYLAFLISFIFLVGCSGSPAPTAVSPVPTACAAEIQDSFLGYIPSLMSSFVTLQDGRFAIDGVPYTARGVNYYPAQYPWRRFLTESNPEAIQKELLLLRTAGFNTLRIFLWNEALFVCPQSSAAPNIDGFQRLDAVIQEAAAQGFHLIVTLNDLPDDAIYSNPPYLQEQTRFIVNRYQGEPAILAWDLRNEGDIDYGANGNKKIDKEPVIEWLQQTAKLVRSVDKNHLITAGWLNDSLATAPYVDFLSFHHWEDAGRLRNRIADLRSADKPILLEEFGYSTFRMSPDDQSRTISEVIDASDAENLLGWLVWAAFDFPLDATCVRPACPSQDNAEHHFGLWLPDYTPKPAVEMLMGR
jgi:hypothetical protein